MTLNMKEVRAFRISINQIKTWKFKEEINKETSPKDVIQDIEQGDEDIEEEDNLED
jgi:hypothetical protein